MKLEDAAAPDQLMAVCLEYCDFCRQHANHQSVVDAVAIEHRAKSHDKPARAVMIAPRVPRSGRSLNSVIRQATHPISVLSQGREWVKG